MACEAGKVASIVAQRKQLYSTFKTSSTTPPEVTLQFPLSARLHPENTPMVVPTEISFDTDGFPIARGLWTADEHERFLQALKLFPHGPWREVSEYVGTRSVKQVQTHAQKYQQKVLRRKRGLRKQKKNLLRAEHRVDQSMSGGIDRKHKHQPHLQVTSPRSPSSMAAAVGPATVLQQRADVTLAIAVETIEPYPFVAHSGNRTLMLTNVEWIELQHSLASLLD